MAMSSAERSRKARAKIGSDLIEVSLNETDWTSMLIAMGMLAVRDQENREAIERAFGKLHDLLASERLYTNDYDC